MSQLSPPDVFCWTKMGEESGESLATIIRRKEWERQLGAGTFVWGIGQSLGKNVESVADKNALFPVIFSPMLSRAKQIDINPSAVAVWTHWEDQRGITHMLPQHMLVTSRATLPSGKLKKNHYALVCKSDQPLKDSKISAVRHALARNVTSNKPVGASQVTAVVKMVDNEGSIDGPSYKVSFDAHLQYPYYIKLVNPKILPQEDVDAIKRISALGNIESWKGLVNRLRESPTENKTESLSDLFEGLDQIAFT